MITGVDYILYTWKNKDAFSKEIEQSFIWCKPHLVIECEDETTDIYLGENKEMFDLMEEKRDVRFYGRKKRCSILWKKKDFIRIKIQVKVLL